MSRLLRLLALAVCACAVLGIVYWGRHQALVPDVVSRKVRIGDSYEQVLAALGPDYGGNLSTAQTGEKILRLAETGVGQLFVPQYSISIFFDTSDKVVGGKASIHYRMDEEFVDLSLSRKVP